MAAVTGAILGAIAVGSQVKAYHDQKEAAKEAEQAQEKSNRMSAVEAQVENARNRRRAIAQARLAQAQNQAGQGSAVQSSSALSGVQSGLSSQLGANFGAQQQQIGTQFGIQGQQQRAATAIRRGNEQAGLWNLAGGIAGMGSQMAMSGLGKSSPSTSYVNSSRAGSQVGGYTGNQYQTWLNNQ